MSPNVEDMNTIEADEALAPAVEATEENAEQAVAQADVAAIETEIKETIAKIEQEADKADAPVMEGMAA
jgi:hypothetical protein